MRRRSSEGGGGRGGGRDGGSDARAAHVARPRASLASYVRRWAAPAGAAAAAAAAHAARRDELLRSVVRVHLLEGGAQHVARLLVEGGRVGGAQPALSHRQHPRAEDVAAKEVELAQVAADLRGAGEEVSGGDWARGPARWRERWRGQGGGHGAPR